MTNLHSLLIRAINHTHEYYIWHINIRITNMSTWVSLNEFFIEAKCIHQIEIAKNMCKMYVISTNPPSNKCFFFCCIAWWAVCDVIPAIFNRHPWPILIISTGFTRTLQYVYSCDLHFHNVWGLSQKYLISTVVKFQGFRHFNVNEQQKPFTVICSSFITFCTLEETENLSWQEQSVGLRNKHLKCHWQMPLYWR